MSAEGVTFDPIAAAAASDDVDGDETPTIDSVAGAIGDVRPLPPPGTKWLRPEDPCEEGGKEGRG